MPFFFNISMCKNMFSQKMRELPWDSKIPIRNIPNETGNKYSNRKSYANFHSNNIHNGPKVEIIPEAHN